MDDKEKLLRIEELSDRLDIAPRTIRRWVKKGMPASKPGKKLYFDWSDVVEWIKEQKG